MTSKQSAATNLRIFQINIHFHDEPDPEALKKTFDKAINWIRYMPNCWLVLTSSDARRWYGRLSPLLGDSDTMLITEIDPDAISAWIQPWIIDWIDKSKKRMQGQAV